MAETVVVVGGTSGMGLEAARLLGRQGYRVAISGRSRASIDRALAQLPEGCSGHPLDFARDGDAAAFFGAIGPFDHLALVGSGQAAWGPFRDLTAASLKAAFDQKFYAYLACLQAALGTIRPDGSIVVTIGGASRSAIPGTAGVAAVNGALQAMAVTMAKELAPLRVNVLSPGLVDTPAYDHMSPEEKAGFFERMGGQLPVGRVGRPEEVAHAVAFLIGNSYVTGAILDVDGGGRLH